MQRLKVGDNVRVIKELSDGEITEFPAGTIGGSRLRLGEV